MTDVTLPLKEKIAVVFDFDETLAPPTHLSMLEKTGIDGEEREDFVKHLLNEGWEKILARAYSWIKYSQASSPTITREMFQSVGEELALYDGVDTLFDRLRSFCPHESIDLEFYLLTAGFVEVPQATSIAHEFKEIWGGAYAFNEDDELIFIKHIITHEEKREYIQQLAKGTGTDGPNVPADTHQHVDEEDMYIPFTQIIYVGDGSSDRPAFSLLHEKGGFAIGLAKDNSAAWKENDKLKKNQKVDNLLQVDYTEGSELMQCLKLAVECISKRILLRKVGKS
ncbi:hypothetical protein WJR50_15720 [Catalinimonas sp. 4WD22]|uniref:hypothetical protein n=1 Tax=Catalinimonas locisalis TaxID=3133978 RepID=UPI0031019F9D